MATLFLESDGWHIGSSVGNTVPATTWAVGNETNTTTSYVWSSVAVTLPNTETIDAIVLMCRSLNTTGTVTIGISNNGGSTTLQEVTVPVTALGQLSTQQTVFLLSSSIVGDGGTNWKIGIKGSSAGNAAFGKPNSTAANFYYTFRRNTTASLSSGDGMVIASGLAPTTGSQSSVTLTWADTASTTYAGVVVCQKGTFQVPTTASTNYTIKMNQNFIVRPGGVCKVGVSAADPIPATSSVEFNFVNSTNIDFGFSTYGHVYMYGSEKTSWVLLNAAAAANATSLTVDSVPTGWKDNNEIVLGPTGRTYSHYEVGALNGDVSTTTLTVDGFAGTGGGIVNAREGNSTTKMQAEVLNLTRNIRFHGTSATLCSYFVSASGAYGFDVVLQYVEFWYLGSNTTDRRGVELRTSGTGTLEVKGCSFHRCTVDGACGLLLYATASVATVNVTDCCAYLISYHGFYVENITTTTSWTFTKIACVSADQNGGFASIRYLKATPVDNMRASGSVGFGMGIENIGSFASTNLNSHSNAKEGFRLTYDFTNNNSIANNTEYDFSGYFAWRNSVTGISCTYGTSGKKPLRFKNIRSIGNLLEGFKITNAIPYLSIKDSTIQGETNFASAYHIYIPNVVILYCLIENVDFGTTAAVGSGNLQACDVVFAGSCMMGKVHIKNCTHSPSPRIVGFDSVTPPTMFSEFFWDTDSNEHGYIETGSKEIRYDAFTYNQDNAGASYSHVGGTGNRSSLITVTSAASTWGSGTGATLVDGASANNLTWNNGQAVSGKWVKFDFGSGNTPIIKEAIYRQSTTTGEGTWQWQGSNDDSNWTNIGNTFTLGGTTVQTITELSGNTTGYRYYRLNGSSGSLSNTPWVYEMEFKLYYPPNSGNGVVTPPTQKLVPLATDIKAESAPIIAFVNSGETKSFSIKIRKTDGKTEGVGAYNGAEPRIILKKNDYLGQTTDQVVATMSAAAGVWETFNITTPSVSATGVFEYVVDCDGTVGWINIAGV